MRIILSSGQYKVRVKNSDGIIYPLHEICEMDGKRKIVRSITVAGFSDGYVIKNHKQMLEDYYNEAEALYRHPKCQHCGSLLAK